MENKSSSILYYLPVTPRDEAWGICCTTAGHQRVTSGTSYPVSRHPERYSFIKNRGRILNEYQLVYITAGAGSFESASCPETAVKAGTMLLLFPSEWHSYSPDPHMGWTEWWVGFRGGQIDRLAENGFLNPSHPVYAIGTSAGIESCYREIIAAVEQERAGFQVLVSSIVLHILGSVLFKHTTQLHSENPLVAKINRAKALLRADTECRVSPESVAAELGMGYTWFRRAFREYVGMAPAQYRQAVRLNKARELLASTSYTVSEIAYRLGFESVSAFSLFFRNRERESPLAYRMRYRGEPGRGATRK